MAGTCVDKNPPRIDVPESVYVPRALKAFADTSKIPSVSDLPVFSMGW